MSTSSFDQTVAPPLTEAEQDQLLAEAQFDVAKGLQQALDLVAREREKARAERLSDFPRALISELKALEGQPVHRPAAEQIARVRALTAASEAAAVEVSYHPGYPNWAEEDLDELVMVLEEIVASGRAPRRLPEPWHLPSPR